MSDLYIESRLQAIKDIASASCTDIKDADNIASFCDEIYSEIPNLDKVVEQLKELKEAYRKKREHTRCRLTETDDCDRCRADHYLEARISTIDKVIDIVKGGGVNE